MATRPDHATQRAVRAYWDTHIHDLDITTHPPGSAGFFADLEQYHFEKLHHLPRLVPFDQYRGRRVLEVGCGAGTDLIRFARHGAQVTGVDLAPSSIALAARNFDAREAAGTASSSPTARRCRFPGVPSISCTRTASCSTRPTIALSCGECRRVLTARRHGGVSGVQPAVVAQCLVAGHQGGPRARRRADAEEIFDRRVSGSAEGVSGASASCPNAFR